MIEMWITLSVIIMLLLFWRQVFVFKMPLKINYAPLVLVIGFISSISIFIFSSAELKDDLKNSLIPLLASFVFYIFMYIIHQLKLHKLRAKRDVEKQLLSTIMEDISDYFAFTGERLTNIENADEKILHTVQKIVENELSEFAQISKTQEEISKRVEQMHFNEERVLSNIEKLLEKEIASLDKAFHRHLDILRITEEDNFNKLQNLLNNMNEKNSNEQMNQAIETLNSHVKSIHDVFKEGTYSIVDETKLHLNSILDKMHSDLQNTKQLSESLYLSTQEYEMKLQQLHKQASLLLQKSDTIHENMDYTFKESQKSRPVYASLNELISRLMDVYTEYKYAKKELQVLAGELGSVEKKRFEIMNEKIESLSEDIHEKVDLSLQDLKEHYHIAEQDVSNTVKTLVAKTQGQKSCLDE